MKIVNGVVCGELLERLVRHDSLNVLVIKNHKSYEELQSHLDVLQAYIKDIGLDLSLKILLVDSIDNVTIKNKLVEEDVDIVLDDKEVLSDKEKTSLSDNS